MTQTATKKKTSRRKARSASSASRASTGTSKRARPGKGKDLVIVESPAKARTVQAMLGDDYRVIASVGHVRDLPNFGYGVTSIENGDFTPKYVIVKDKRRGVDKSSVVKKISEAAAEAERVYLSTDPDREGEAISWHIREAAGIPEEKTSRVVFHEITRPAIEEAFNTPGELNMSLVDAQQTRRVLDRLIGFPLTWFVQKKIARTATAGRVQSVALRLVVEREREIQQFNPVEYWTLEAQLEQGASTFAANL
ncbi:MAG TPA: toprim domain-containing protein, partial [Dehalococcoidia bacterium]|nr:toprim domain-containing protein [Dehalococcoidia bacterium]